MKKKVLFVATIYGFLNSFESNNMRILKEMGYEVHCIANPYEDLIPGHAKVKTPNIDAVGGVIKHGWRCARSPYDKNNIVALRQLKALLKKENFDLVHCHTPMGGVLARIACEPYRKKGMKVIYTAHGFHFYDGAPKKNWLIYYPIEKELSRVTDVLINITLEDYNRARKYFHAGHTYYVPGVGVDLDKFKSNVNTANIRETIGVPTDSAWLLSVGELNENKNHETVIRAISQIHNPLIFYTIAGEGPKREYLEKLIQELGLQKQVRLLGFRSDVNDLYHAADIYIHPSLREGLSVATMEAMACGLPIIEGKIRGNVDLVDENGGILYNPASVEECVSSVKRGLALTTADRESMGGHNQTKIQGFGRKTVEDKMREIYSQVSCVTDNAM